MREQAETKILAVLTDDQKSKWTSMQGKAFSLKDDN
jgi:hypothetical protein